MKSILAVVLFLLLGIFNPQTMKAQTNPSVEELHNFFNGRQLLITYREGEAVYGTYYFLEIHYCPNGFYGLYGTSEKQTVLDNVQKSSWQEFGNWKIITQDELNGIHYAATNGGQQFYPIYKLQNGDMFVSEGVSIVNRGAAICQ